jgi:pyrimidine operon attenuation protein/uracil phosphoribosyltransferase
VRHRDRLLRSALRERFAVTVASDETIEGLLWDVDDSTLVLVDAVTISERGHRAPIDGWVYLPRRSVLYMQRPLPPDGR